MESDPAASPGADQALLDLLVFLRRSGYRFVTPTPETHRRVIARNGGQAARDLRGAFGWNLPFSPGLLPAPLFARMVELKLLREESGLYRSEVRAASLGDRLFLHSAYPTSRRDSVFFGPDSYRFARFIEAALAGRREASRLVDLGAGAGVGAIVAGGLLGDARLTLIDINPAALGLARINARHAGVAVETVEGDGLAAIDGAFDLVVANPPFIHDPERRLYRHGGGDHGAGLSVQWALAAARRIAPGGRVLLYTGSAIVDGKDALESALRKGLAGKGWTLRYAEIDPDIFGEQLGEPGYEDVERIAAVGAVIERSGA